MRSEEEKKSRFAAAIRKIDEANAHDPNKELVEGREQPREWVYSRWLTDWVLRLSPEGSEELRLAARCQHVCRWTIPRSSYPMDRPGYLKWRAVLKEFHAEKAGELLREAGYGDDVIARVQDLVRKKNFPKDPDSRILEDALCMVFLERQFPDLARKTSEEKVINALHKSWKKMTPQARAIALTLPYGEKEKELLQRAELGRGD